MCLPSSTLAAAVQRGSSSRLAASRMVLVYPYSASVSWACSRPNPLWPTPPNPVPMATRYIVVDKDGSGPDLPAHPQRPIAVLGEHRRDESELGGVGDPHRLVFVTEGDQGDDRTEDLLGGYPHAGDDVGQHRRRDVEAVRQLQDRSGSGA